MVRSLFMGIVYLMFFISGAAALMYEVVWVRSLSLIFGGSHLAVTIVLSIFMAGLAIGSYTIGKHVDRIKKPLMLYGQLELGIALFAVVFAVLMKLYPSIYVLLAQGRDDSILYLSSIRIAFAVFALIIPTTLMGGTLPVLSRFASHHSEKIGTHLSLLYGINTLGAVAGTTAAGFFFLRFYSVSTTLKTAILMNVVIGITSILLQRKAEVILGSSEVIAKDSAATFNKKAVPVNLSNTLPLKLVLWGIGVSGFCALGYEVLWTRILTIVVGASVYGFTTMLAAFLTGIALGSNAYGLFVKIFRAREITKFISGFGIVQVIIGLTALLVTIYIRDLPGTLIRLKQYFQELNMDIFETRQWTNLILAFLYMIVPAFFMGLAFPLAGKIHAEYKKAVGKAVGEVLAYNTIGAILGAALSGFVLIYLFSIERSLQMLTLINISFGLLVIVSLRGVKLLYWGVSGLTAAVLVFMALNPDALRIWNRKYFAIFRANQPEAFRTPQMVKEALKNTDVLYYDVGVEAIVSSIKIKGGIQAFVTNGRVEASDDPGDQQVQFTLGHLPMLLNKNPRKVLVVGLGSGMTAGATSAHPSVEKITLVELEPKMIGVAKTFEKYNHHILDNPKLKIIFNDGRNFLLTTKEKYDVITADPIHPWFRGAGYLYTTEYFKLASGHLSEGGVMCQWLPIYELTVKNLKSVVRTFSENFKHTLLWLTYYDSVIVGSNSTIIIDEAELERRISVPAISSDLKRVMMSSAKGFLSYFAMGTKGMKAFGKDGIINTDDNLYLEFSAPLSIGKVLSQYNLNAIVKHRENILAYLVPEEDKKAQVEQKRTWEAYNSVARIYDFAHSLFLGGYEYSVEFKYLLDILDKKYPWYAPGRFLKDRYLAEKAKVPRLLEKTAFTVLNERGEAVVVEISAVISRISDEMAIVDFLDNDARIIYGSLNVPGANRDEFINRFVDEVLNSIQAVYQQEVRVAYSQGRTFPPAESTLPKIKETIIYQIKKNM